MLRKIINGIRIFLIVSNIIKKRLHNDSLAVCISTPCYGNVGDHTIELAEQEILCECGFTNRILDVSSYEYSIVNKLLPKLINTNDVIVIDGGGNFGDTWEGTLEQIIDIVKTYSKNRIIIFPESWYFSRIKGNPLLQKVSEVFSYRDNLIIYARDKWSYKKMKENIKGTEIRYSLDSVFFKKYSPKSKKENNIIGICIREDKESIGHVCLNDLIDDIKIVKKSCNSQIIKNDIYSHVEKKERINFFKDTIEKYERSDLIITDRFHGFVFSILSHTPCIIFDNKTGKIGHFYEDVSQYLSGCMMITDNNYDRSELRLLLNHKKLHVSEDFYDLINRYREDIKNILEKWRV